MKRYGLFTLAAAAIAGICTGLVSLGAKPVASPVQRPQLTKPVAFSLPPETSAFKPGPNLEIVQANCGGCHSADYVATQPHGPKFKDDFWKAEVTKMINVYGAPIDQADVGKIVDYLVQTYAN